MTGLGGCRDIRHALGAYVLGAIEPVERAFVDGHLASCQDCREELAGLAGLPALLRRVPVSEAERLAGPGPALDQGDDLPPDGLLRSLLVRVARQRRARRLQAMAAAAAVALLALGAGAGGVALSHHLTSVAASRATMLDSWQTVSGTSPGTGAGLTVKYAGTGTGTTMAVEVAGVPAGTVCEFRVTDSAGHTWVLARWRVAYTDGEAWYPVSAPVAATGLRAFQVTAHGKVVASVSAR